VWNNILYGGMTQPADPTALHDTTVLQCTLAWKRRTVPCQAVGLISHLQLQPNHHRSTRTLFKLTTCIKIHSNHSGWWQATFNMIPICHQWGPHPSAQCTAVNIGWQESHNMLTKNGYNYSVITQFDVWKPTWPWQTALFHLY